MVNMRTFAQLLVETGLATPDQIRGCMEDEVLEIEEKFGVELPRSYRDFLLVMGKGAGSLFVGTDFFYPRLLEVREGADELLLETKSSFQIPDNSFVFSLHQGYVFDEYFLLTSDDPPVFLFMELDTNATLLVESFTEFLLQTVNDYLHTKAKRLR
jgi:hypothetical protein